MTVVTPKVRISTPTEPILPGRGFYQLEEDALYVQVGPFMGQRRFFSFLESNSVSLYFDREGRLIFVEVDTPRRQWPIESKLKAPSVTEPADIRWLDFRDTLGVAPHLRTNKTRSLLCISFQKPSNSRYFYLAEHVIAEVNQSNELCAVWIDDIVDDLAGQEIAAFRKSLRKAGVPAS